MFINISDIISSNKGIIQLPSSYLDLSSVNVSTIINAKSGITKFDFDPNFKIEDLILNNISSCVINISNCTNNYSNNCSNNCSNINNCNNISNYNNCIQNLIVNETPTNVGSSSLLSSSYGNNQLYVNPTAYEIGNRTIIYNSYTIHELSNIEINIDSINIPKGLWIVEMNGETNTNTVNTTLLLSALNDNTNKRIISLKSFYLTLTTIIQNEDTKVFNIKAYCETNINDFLITTIKNINVYITKIA